MIRALLAGVAGLRNHQTRMDVIGNNISNVNTVGFKSSRLTFREAFAQTIRDASRPLDDQGGINPMQIGMGMNLGSIDQLFSQGSLESTGQPFDMAIQGDGMFVLRDGEQTLYTRAGNFQLDGMGRLVSAGTGFLVQGSYADVDGNFTSGSTIEDIQVSAGTKAPPKPTDLIALRGNLTSGATVGDVKTMGITVYDSLGTAHSLNLTFTNTGAGTWDWSATCDTAPVTPSGNGTVTFNDDGSLQEFTYPGSGTALTLTPTVGAPFDLQVNAGTVDGIDGLCGFANPSNALVESQNGYQAGELINVSVDSRGVVSGQFSNGVTRPLARIALASFNNPSGLMRSGESVYEESPNAGPAIIGFVGESTAATITPGALESSNVDISQEFSNMIIAQRGFQANARVITAADEMLNELVNLKR
jgi:flagellar hook protein FlgE